MGQEYIIIMEDGEVFKVNQITEDLIDAHGQGIIDIIDPVAMTIMAEGEEFSPIEKM